MPAKKKQSSEATVREIRRRARGFAALGFPRCAVVEALLLPTTW
jgi:hypothetical protein